jgi:hypothetical protein
MLGLDGLQFQPSFFWALRGRRAALQKQNVGRDLGARRAQEI